MTGGRDSGSVVVMARTLYLIDGHSQMYRSYYAPFRDLTSPTGEPTRATYVFSNMLLRFLAEKKPDYIAMAIDGPASELKRREVYSEYKITRKPAPEDFPPQEKRILQIVEAMGIPILAAKGYEADDILATAAERFACDELKVVLVSRDKDLDQLVGENVLLYDPMKDQEIDAAAIAEQKGYAPDKAIEVQTLMGDSIDNIPGVKGVGGKTAVKLIAKYGSAEAVVAHADEQTPKLRENLLAAADTLALTRRLVTLDRNVPIELDLEAMRLTKVSTEPVRRIFEELGFNRLIDRLDEISSRQVESPPEPSHASEAPSESPEGAEARADDFDYRCVNTPEELDALAKELSKVKPKRLAVDTETTGTNPMRCELVGVSLAWKPLCGVYLPVRGPLGSTVLDIEKLRDAIGGILADENVQKIGQNLKYDLHVLSRHGFSVRGKMFDTMIAAHVLDSTRPTYKLDALAMEFLNHRCIPIEELIGRGKTQATMDTIPVETVATYAAEDADVSLRLADALSGKLVEDGLTDLFTDLEMPLLTVLFEMERRGVIVDPQALKDMETELSRRADDLRERIISAAGRDFNPDSPKQLAEVLFGDLDLPVIKRKKTGPSTDVSVLEELASMHELPALVLDYRQLTKLLGTYLLGLASCIHPNTGRVHTSFHQAGTVTGRLSSSDPNLQNIPVRTEIGRRIRSAFVAPRGSVLLSADYSQVELRVLAHLCQDETLCKAFADDEDIHRIVAAEVFGVPHGEVTDEQRARAKTVNFGIIYGQTAFGLARTLRISRSAAGEFIKAYRMRFPKIDDFLHSCVAQAKEAGYVQTIMGRRRRIAEIDSRNPQRRSAAERLAINSVVQGSAADLIKQAMLNIDARTDKERRPARMLLQIHDELVFEIPREAVDEEKEMIVSEMKNAVALRVPLKVDVGIGKNWMEAK